MNSWQPLKDATAASEGCQTDFSIVFYNTEECLVMHILNPTHSIKTKKVVSLRLINIIGLRI